MCWPARAAGGLTYRAMREQAEPRLVGKEYADLRNRHYNAFKHHNDVKGLPRDDREKMADFSDDRNREAMFIGWWDYGRAGFTEPLEASIYGMWFLALHPEALPPTPEGAAFLASADQEFGPLPSIDSRQQKRRLVRSVQRWRADRRMQRDPGFDLRPLILSAPWR
jgi:hypothetical protein